MATNATQFKARFIEFAAVPDPTIDIYLGDAALFMSSTGKWLEYYDVAQAYYAAHLLTVGQYSSFGDAGALAPIKRSEVDDVVIEKAIGTLSPSANDTLSTSYGKRYRHYRHICLSGIRGV